MEDLKSATESNNMYKKLLFLIPFIAILLPFTAQAACGSGYSFCQTFTVNHLKVPSTQTSFTVLATTTQAVLKTVANSGHVQNTTTFNGQTVPADLIFSTAADCSAAMSWDVEDYVSTTGELEAWILNTSLSSSADTVFYMCYGNASVTTYQGGAVGAAYDSNYKLVHHLPNGTTLTANDSTINGNNGTLINIPTAIAGQIDGAASFNGSSQSIDSSNPTIVQNNWTLEAWMNPGNLSQEGMAVCNCGSSGYGFGVGNGAGGTGAKFTALFQNIAFIDTGYTFASANVWYDVVMVRNAGTTSFYVNGVQTANTSASTPGTPNTNFQEGDDNNSGFHNYFNGKVDEARVSITPRSADWITTEYNNQVSVPQFLTIGAEQSAGVGVANEIWSSLGGVWSIMGGRWSIL